MKLLPIREEDWTAVEWSVAREFTLYWNNLKDYEECPQKFLWKRGWEDIDLGGGPGRPKPKTMEKSRHHAVMGIVIQDVLETFYNDELWRHPQNLKHRLLKMTEASFAKELGTNYIDWRDARMGRDEMEQTCKDGVLGFMQTMKHHKFLGPYSKAEEKLKGWIDKYTPIGGYTDVIIRRPDTGITIIDGKNSKTKDQYTDPDQLRFYALCFWLSYKVMPDRLAFVWYRYPYDGEEETGVTWVEFTKRDLQVLAKRAKEVRTKMHRRLFEATPSSQACKFCNYEDVCPERQAHKAANRRKKAKTSLPVVDEAEGGFVEFDLSAQVVKKPGSKR